MCKRKKKIITAAVTFTLIISSAPAYSNFYDIDEEPICYQTLEVSEIDNQDKEDFSTVEYDLLSIDNNFSIEYNLDFTEQNYKERPEIKNAFRIYKQINGSSFKKFSECKRFLDLIYNQINAESPIIAFSNETIIAIFNKGTSKIKLQNFFELKNSVFAKVTTQNKEIKSMDCLITNYSYINQFINNG